jgi:hypothetical protein
MLWHPIAVLAGDEPGNVFGGFHSISAEEGITGSVAPSRRLDSATKV